MTRKQTWRYKCDFCGKTGYSAGSMGKHEKHCTANPNRECRVCKMVEGEQKSADELLAAAWRGLEVLEDIADGCPACMLAAIRRIPVHYPGGTADDEGDEFSKWKFKDAMKQIWDQINEDNASRDGYY
jgi:hypothetical protein